MVVDVEKLPLEGQGGLFEVLCEIPDPRQRRGVRYRIQSIMATALCAVLAGARSITAIAEWAAEQSPQTLRRMGSKYGRAPRERTYRRIFAIVDVQEIDRRTGRWMAEQQRSLAAAAVALDGKTVRGSQDGDKGAVHLLSAIVHGSGTVVAQVAVDSKTNEITRVEPLLEELEKQIARVSLAPGGLVHVASELPFEHVVVVAKLLLLVEADPVVLHTATAKAVRPRRRELPLGRVLRYVGDGHANAAGEFDLGTEVSSHGGNRTFMSRAAAASMRRRLRPPRRASGERRIGRDANARPAREPAVEDLLLADVDVLDAGWPGHPR